jgi:peptidoglycan/xylan/chitin deacetylase (PgdA/CDA1 family)
MSDPQPPGAPERDGAPPCPRREECRSVLRLFTILMVLGLLAASLWPGAALPAGWSAPTEPSVAEIPPPAPQPTAPQVDPAPPQTPKKPDRLPDLPKEQPSLLVVHGDRACPQIALTYDAGSGADGTTAILAVLQKHGVAATFFLTGRWVERYEELARRIAADGHEIANHTYSHPDLTTLSFEAIISEVEQGEEAIRRITGKETRPLFREPYGAFNEAQRRAVRQAGYSYSIYWDLDTIDWRFPGVEATVERIMTRRQNGSIVLMHLNVPDSAIASDLVIPQLRAEGYHLVTVTELLTCQEGR